VAPATRAFLEAFGANGPIGRAGENLGT
jgi:hypothetical protein